MDNDKLEYRVRINFKSGHQHTSWFKSFKTSTQHGKIVSIQWQEADTTRLMYIDLDSIESVTQLEIRAAKKVKL